MKTKGKRIFSMLLSVLMLMGCMSAVAFADEADVPTKTGSVAIGGVEKGDTVEAYQFVKAVYSEDGNSFANWDLVENSGLDKVPETLTADVAQAVYAAKANLTKTAVSYDETEGCFVLNGDVGMYLITATSADGKTVYNPAIASINPDSDNELNVETDYDVWVKKTTTSFAKKIVVGDSKVDGDTIQNGETAYFEITATLPNVSKEFGAVAKISDTLDSAFTIDPDAIHIYLGEVKDENLVGVDDCKLNTKANGFDVEFTSEFIGANGGKTVVITYNAEFNAPAGSQNFQRHDNDASYTYGNEVSTQVITDKTSHYTFEIDGNLNGINETIVKTFELNKVSQIVNEFTTEDGTSYASTALKNAIFSLTGTNYNQSATTDALGHMNFSGLDAGVKYTLVETKAPRGYAINTTEHTVEIVAEFDNADGTQLKGYSVKLDGTVVAKYAATFDLENNKVTVEVVESNIPASQIENTKVGTLPHTGGNGIALALMMSAMFAVVAVAGIAVGKKKATSIQ